MRGQARAYSPSIMFRLKFRKGTPSVVFRDWVPIFRNGTEAVPYRRFHKRKIR